MSEGAIRPAAKGAVVGLAAAALFGASAPVAKVLLGAMSPQALAALLYLGAAVVLWSVRVLFPSRVETHLRRQDVPSLLGVILFGGVLGPLLMLFGLTRTTALTGSLLLNLEAPFTMLLAVAVFGEHLGARGALAAGCIVAGAAVLGVDSGPAGGELVGYVAIAGACLSWAVDNNLTQRLSLRDPFAVVRWKALAAGLCNAALAIATKQAWPALPFLLAGLVLGAMSYGVSIVLDAYALRWIGAAREAAYFATAPFVGALGSALFLGSPLRGVDGLAFLVMAAGVILLLRERHGHLHAHEALEHTHLHAHDEHHVHEHDPSAPPGEPHVHLHRHAPLVHDHPHVPDVHHRHRH